MAKLIFSLIFLVTACEPARAGTTSNPTTTSPPAARPLAADELAPAGIIDPEGPRPGESAEQEQATMSAAFEAQPYDEGWRRAQEARFRAGFAEAQRDDSLKSLECRQTLCKLVVQEQGNDRKRVVRRILGTAVNEEDGFIGSHAFVQYPTEDRLQTTIYVSRNHYSLPDSNGRVTERQKVKPTP